LFISSWSAQSRMASRLEQLRSSLNENLDSRTRETTEKCIALLEAYDVFQKKNVFHVGDFVRFKKGMSCRIIPKEDEFGIVTEVLSEPIFDPTRKSAGNPSFREPLSLRVGLIVNDDLFQEFFYDGQRMEIVDVNTMDESQRTLAEKLSELHQRLGEPRTEAFKTGDIVQWKKGLKNTKRPDYNQQCVVMETFPPIFTNKRGSGSSGFREPDDVRIGVLDEDGDLMIYLFDSRRFEIVPESRWNSQ